MTCLTLKLILYVVPLTYFIPFVVLSSRQSCLDKSHRLIQTLGLSSTVVSVLMEVLLIWAFQGTLLK